MIKIFLNNQQHRENGSLCRCSLRVRLPIPLTARPSEKKSEAHLLSNKGFRSECESTLSRNGATIPTRESILSVPFSVTSIGGILYSMDYRKYQNELLSNNIDSNAANL